MGWEEALLCDIKAKQDFQNEVLEEMECREWTDDDEDSIPSTPSSSFWWVESLLGAAATMDLEIPTHMPTVQILSACTGVCAEGEVMKAHDVSQCIEIRKITVYLHVDAHVHAIRQTFVSRIS